MDHAQERMHASARLKSIALWLLLGAIAAGVCSLTWPQAHYNDERIPVSMDSWYHAVRILEMVADPSSLYEFDAKIHAPEGSLLPWPWGYDYAWRGWCARRARSACPARRSQS